MSLAPGVVGNPGLERQTQLTTSGRMDDGCPGRPQRGEEVEVVRLEDRLYDYLICGYPRLSASAVLLACSAACKKYIIPHLCVPCFLLQTPFLPETPL